MSTRKLRRLLVSACAVAALACTGPVGAANADGNPAGDPATVSMNAGGGPG